MSMQEAFKSYWANCFNWQGTASRQEFWKNFLLWGIIRLIFDGGVLFDPDVNQGRLLIVQFIFDIILFPWFALFKRRLNDTGMDYQTSSWIVWGLILLPFLGTYASILGFINQVLVVGTLIVCSFQPGHFSN